MTAIVAADLRQMTPVSGMKEIIILTDSATDDSYTFDATDYFTTIYGLYVCNATGGVEAATFSGLTVTMGNLTGAAVHCIRIWGV
jgi:hypothetical protein